MSAGKSLLLCLLALTAIFLIAGCAGEKAYKEGIELSDKGKIDEGLEKIEEAVKDEPDNPQYRITLMNRRMSAINALLLSAETSIKENRLADAEAQYTRVLKLDPENTRAHEGLKQITQAHKHAELMTAARADFDKGDIPAAMENIRAVLLENPKQSDALALLKKIDDKQARNKFTSPALRKYTNPVTLEFRDAPVKMVFDVLSNSTGINFILDKDLRPDQRVSIFARNMTLDKALNLLLDSNQLDKKIINENTVVVYPRTPQKAKEYEELMVRTFYLANADPKQTANMLKTILKTKDVYVDDRLNMIVIRDNPEGIHQAEKLIAGQDLPEPEVLLEVEVLEVDRTSLLNLGVQPPTQFGVLNSSASVGGTQTPLTIEDLLNLNKSTITVGGAPVGVNIDQQFSNVNVLANPRIRVRNREKAKVYIGNRVPVITSTVTTTGGAPVTAEVVQYIDTGIKLDVEPNIYLGGDVSIKITLEVNALGTKTTTTNGSVVYETNTRTANTLLQLKDGENQLLAGLISADERSSADGWPGLAEIPIVGRLFSSHQDNKLKTEVVLSITPHIVRNIPLPDAGVTQFWSGTEQGGGVYTDNYSSQNVISNQQVLPISPPAPPTAPQSVPGIPPMPGTPPVPAPAPQTPPMFPPIPPPTGTGTSIDGSIPSVPFR